MEGGAACQPNPEGIISGGSRNLRMMLRKFLPLHACINHKSSYLFSNAHLELSFYAPYFVRLHQGKLADLVSLSHHLCPSSNRVWRSQCKEGRRGREGNGNLDASVGSAHSLSREHLSSTAEFLYKSTAATLSIHPPLLTCNLTLPEPYSYF